MDKKYIKNIEFATALSLVDQVTYLQGQIVSKTLSQNEAVSITLFAFDKGEEISTHHSNGDAFVYVLDGEAEIVIEDNTYQVKSGDTIVMPSLKPHSVYAKECFKMLLVVVFK